MDQQIPIHEIQLGAVRAFIWEDTGFDSSGFRISFARVGRPGEPRQPGEVDRFQPDDLPLVAELSDLAHLWICQQAELIA